MTTATTTAATTATTTTAARVGILMGSDSDWPVMSAAAEACHRLGLAWEARVLSFHRTPEALGAYARGAHERGLLVLICGAGKAAHLAGAVAAWSPLPVIGVPVASGRLGGLDALLATVQMPKGVPVATVAIGGAYNAGLLAAQIIGISDPEVRARFVAFKSEQAENAKGKILPPLDT